MLIYVKDIGSTISYAEFFSSFFSSNQCVKHFCSRFAPLLILSRDLNFVFLCLMLYIHPPPLHPQKERLFFKHSHHIISVEFSFDK